MVNKEQKIEKCIDVEHTMVDATLEKFLDQIAISMDKNTEEKELIGKVKTAKDSLADKQNKFNLLKNEMDSLKNQMESLKNQMTIEKGILGDYENNLDSCIKEKENIRKEVYSILERLIDSGDRSVIAKLKESYLYISNTNRISPIKNIEKKEIMLISEEDVFEVPKGSKNKWGNTILALDDPDGNTRIDRDYTNVNRSKWLLDEKDYWKGSYLQTYVAVLSELYKRDPVVFAEIISDSNSRPHGPRTALYIVIAEEIEMLTNKGQFAEQINDSDIYAETCLCTNDFAEVVLAMARSLGYGPDRFRITNEEKKNS